MIARSVERLQRLLFGHRALVLALLALFTVVMGVFASRLHMDAGFDKQLPQHHEYIRTFFEFRDEVFGANRIIVVVRARDGEIWSAPGLRKLYDVTQSVMFLPGIDRRTVTSLWTPNTRVLGVTEEGFKAEDVIGGDITPDRLDAGRIERIRHNALVGGYIGTLVSTDNAGAMVVADLLETDRATGKKLDYSTSRRASSRRCAAATRTPATRSRSSASPSRSATSPTARPASCISSRSPSCSPRCRSGCIAARGA